MLSFPIWQAENWEINFADSAILGEVIQYMLVHQLGKH